MRTSGYTGLILIVLSISLVAFRATAVPEPTAAEACTDYAFAEERFGQFAGVDLSFQMGACNGGGHTSYVHTLVARDPKTKRILTSFDDEIMGDGVSFGPLRYQNGVFLSAFEGNYGAAVIRYDAKSKKFVKLEDDKKDDVQETEGERPKMTAAELVGATYEKTLQKLADFREKDCEVVDRLGDGLATDANVYESAQLKGVHKSADALYKSGRKYEAAQLVLRYLGSNLTERYKTLKCEMGGCEDGAEPNLNDKSGVTKRVHSKLKFFSDGEGNESGSSIQEWNDLAFYLLKAGYKAPAITILDWVLSGDPARDVAIKNLKEAKALSKSKPIVFGLDKFSSDENKNLRSLRKFKSDGGQLVWHYGSLDAARFLQKVKKRELRSFARKDSCVGDSAAPDTLLDLALATGQLKVAEFLWANGFSDEQLESGDLWASALFGVRGDSAKWLVEHKVGLGDEKALSAISNADDVAAYKLWAAESPHARALSEKLCYAFDAPPRIFDFLFETKAISYVHRDREHPTLLFVLADPDTKIRDVIPKIKSVIAAGVSPNVLNQDRRLSALDIALGISASRRDSADTSIAKALKALGAKSGSDLLLAGKHPEFSDDEFTPESLALFEKQIAK